MSDTKTKRTNWPVTVTVEVDSYELEDAGYHHEDDCPATSGRTPTAALEQTVQALHELAHPNGALFAETCLAQPCWNLYGGGL